MSPFLLIDGSSLGTLRWIRWFVSIEKLLKPRYGKGPEIGNVEKRAKYEKKRKSEKKRAKNDQAPWTGGAWPISTEPRFGQCLGLASST